MRKTFLTLGFVALFPFHSVSAEGLNTYYNEELKYTLSFQDSWVLFNDEMINILTPEERENSPAIFFNPENSSQLFIRHLPAESEKFQLYNDLITYIKETPEERQKLEKKINPISTELGRTIEDYSIDIQKEQVILHLLQTSSIYGEIRTTLFWSMNENTFVELEFFDFQNDPLFKEEVASIINSFTYTGSLTTTIQEGSLDILENRLISERTPPLEGFIDFLNKPIVWYGVGLVALLSISIYLTYRFI